MLVLREGLLLQGTNKTVILQPPLVLLESSYLEPVRKVSSVLALMIDSR